MKKYEFTPVGIVHSCYKEKFGTPRQPGLIPSAEAVIELVEPYNQPDYIRELEQFSHLWLVFIFHQHVGKEIKATVRPPRLGGNKRIGVFASRSPFRPNPLGLSVVRIKSIENKAGRVSIVVSGVDLIDGTPILDIKPYIPYTDAITDAHAGYANDAPGFQISVSFKNQTSDLLKLYESEFPMLKQLIIDTISMDPRPAYSLDGGEYGIKLHDFNIRWSINGTEAAVISIERLAG